MFLLVALLLCVCLFFFFFLVVLISFVPFTDEILENSLRKIEEAIFEIDNPLHVGNQSATAEYALTQAEKFSSTSKCVSPAFLPPNLAFKVFCSILN